MDNYASRINEWIDGGNYFVGLTEYLYSTNDELVYRFSDLPPVYDKDLMETRTYDN